MRDELRLATLSILMAAVLAGCSATPESLQSEPDVDSQTFPASYDVIFQHVMQTATTCFTPNNLPISSIYPLGEIHRDRNYADFRMVASSIGIAQNYFLSARIEQNGTGSRVTTKANNRLIARRLSSMLMAWAAGGSKCSP